MLQRYMGLITDQGLDAAIPLIDDPEALSDYKEQVEEEFWEEAGEVYHRAAPIVFETIFEKEKNVVINNEGYIAFGGYNSTDEWNKAIKTLRNDMADKIIEFGKSRGAVSSGDYQMFQLRAQVVNPDVKAIFAMDEKDFEVVRSRMSPYHSAFYILDGMIKGKTELGRFGETKPKQIMVLNKMEDPDVKKLKKLRREFFDKINRSGEEDPDEI